jgi:hypothetical protein
MFLHAVVQQCVNHTFAASMAISAQWSEQLITVLILFHMFKVLS